MSPAQAIMGYQYGLGALASRSVGKQLVKADKLEKEV